MGNKESNLYAGPEERKSGPLINEIREIKLPQVGRSQLSGGSDIYFLQTSYASVVRLEIVIDAGRLKESQPLVSRAAAAMLKDGSRHYSREEISRIADETGGSISINAGLEYASIQLYCLENHIDTMLHLIRDMLLNPLYNEKGLIKYIQKKKNQLLQDLSINEILAYRKLTEMLFGPRHPYGYNSTGAMYDALDPTVLKEFHKSHYKSGNMQLYLCCRQPEFIIEKLDRVWRELPDGATSDIHFELSPSFEKFNALAAANNSQSSVRIGKRLFSRDNPDFAGMYFVNTLLGGFFGSRLVHQIREKRGLTYNIYSSIETFRKDGFFIAGCETSPHRTEQVAELILLEMDKLREGLIPEAEILLVKNYLFGFFISTLDGPLNTIEMIKVLTTEGNGLHSFYQMIEEFKNINIDRVRELAERYLKSIDMTLVKVQ